MNRHLMMHDGGGVSSGTRLQTTEGIWVTVKTQLDLQGIVDQLSKLLEDAITKDRRETEIAIEELTGPCGMKQFSWNESQTRAQWNTIEEAARKRRDELKEALTNRENNFMTNADQPVTLMNGPRADWQTIVDDLESIATQVPLMKISNWTGDPANAYHSTVTKQENNVEQVRALADNAGRSIEGVATLQAAISQAIYDTLYSAYDRNFLALDETATRNEFRNIGRSANETQYSYYFYERTLTMMRRYDTLIKYVVELRPPSASWSKAAQGIGETLSTATQETIKGHTPTVGTYTTDDDAVQSQEGQPYGPFAHDDNQRIVR